MVAIASLSILSMSNAVNVICSSVGNIYRISSSLMTNQDSTNLENIIDFIEKTDLISTLDTYSKLVNEIEDYESNAVNDCLHNIKKIIKEIESELILINNKRIKNDSMYMKWFAYTFKSNIKNLERLNAKLEKAINTLNITYSLVSRDNKKPRVKKQEIKDEQIENSYIFTSKIFSNKI